MHQEQANAVSGSASAGWSRFLQDQIQYLAQMQPEIVKMVQTGALPVEVEKLKEVNWEKELELFTALDLNKPALQGEYQITETQKGPVLQKVLEKRPDADVLVQQLIIETDTAQQSRKLKAILEQDNMLYYSQKILTIETASTAGKEHISAYNIQGLQKLILFDSLTYQVQVKVLP